MNKKTTKTTQDQSYTNTYGWETSPITPQMQSVIDLANKPVEVDPSTQQRFGEMKDEYTRSYNDPYGAYTTPDVREKALRSGLYKIDRDRDKALREERYRASQASWAKKVAVAGLTQPQLVTTGGTGHSSGTQVQQGGFWQAMIAQAMQGAAAAGGAAGG